MTKEKCGVGVQKKPPEIMAKNVSLIITVAHIDAVP